MRFSMYLMLVCAFFMSSVSMPSVAHDLGVATAILKQESAQKYVLKVNTSTALANQITAPELPKNCVLLEPYAGQLVDGLLWYRFRCHESLSAIDTIAFRWQRDGVLVTALWLGKDPVKSLFLRDGDTILVPLQELSAAGVSLYVNAKRYIYLGITHILAGVDHLLFVFAVLLLVRSPVLLLKTITAFTVAHSITLALAFLEVVSVSIRPVEACIAFSIVILASEIIRINRGEESLSRKYPWVVAGGFGLLHGLGFASALHSLGVPESDVPIALLFFNVGVEIGQLSFITLLVGFGFAVNCVAKHFGKAFESRKQWSSPLAYGLGIVAMYWTIERSALILG